MCLDQSLLVYSTKIAYTRRRIDIAVNQEATVTYVRSHVVGGWLSYAWHKVKLTCTVLLYRGGDLVIVLLE